MELRVEEEDLVELFQVVPGFRNGSTLRQVVQTTYALGSCLHWDRHSQLALLQ